MIHCLPGTAGGLPAWTRVPASGGVFLRMRTTATVGGQVLAVLVCLLAASVASVAGQANTGTLEGVVRDESGGVLPGATVTATHAESGFAVERVTGSDGRFYMASLPIGEWTITAELPGFRRVVRTGIFLTWAAPSIWRFSSIWDSSPKR